jgi:hypothetical protein
MNIDSFIDLYIAITMTLFGISTIMLLREANRNNFRMPFFSGTYGAILYYKEIKRQNKKVSKIFWFYILANLNFIICAITFLVRGFYIL